MADTVKAWIEERRAIHAASTEGPWENTSINRRLSGDFTVCIDEVRVGHLTPRYRPEGASWPQRYDDYRERLIYSEPDAIYWGGSSSDVTFIVDAHNMFPHALDALNKVLELHKPDEFGECDTCIDACGNGIQYPCPTVQAIEGAIND